MVDITLIKLQDMLPFDSSLLSYISYERRVKILRFQNSNDKKRSLIAEIMIRMSTFYSLGISPLHTKISYNAYGKPYIDNVRGYKFNISHSGNYVAFAKSRNKIGIDIEYMRETEFSIAKRCYTERECQYINSFETLEKRLDAFYRLWTLKESYIKAIGKGMKIPLNSFEFEIGRDIKVKPVKREQYKFLSYKMEPYMLSCCYSEKGGCNPIHFLDEQELYNKFRTVITQYQF